MSMERVICRQTINSFPTQGPLENQMKKDSSMNGLWRRHIAPSAHPLLPLYPNPMRTHLPDGSESQSVSWSKRVLVRQSSTK